MRLLNTETLDFQEFFDLPAYAILSHKWLDDEVSFEDYILGRKKDSQSYDKIVKCCRFARARGYKYVWIDTCCIDKRSSSELSESINSMWEWYGRARECYAYLADVISSPSERPLNNPLGQPSEWFSRGWTLQELLAPRNVLFCDRDWKKIGRKDDLDIVDEVSKITSIPMPCLASHFVLDMACVAQKLSWAANRRTTRKEDIAYCLLGLVGINMPLLYGEGDKAFLRLQQEIIRQTDDQSIFAWKDATARDDQMSGLIAPDIKAFASSGSVRSRDGYSNPYAVTNQGIDMNTPSSQIQDTDIYVIALNCEYSEMGDNVADDKMISSMGHLMAEGPALRCAIAVRKDREFFSRIHIDGLGHHLTTLYPPNVRTYVEGRFLVRSTRWRNEYELANIVIRRFMQRFVKRKMERATEVVTQKRIHLDIDPTQEGAQLSGGEVTVS